MTLFNHAIMYPLIAFKTNVKIDLIIFQILEMNDLIELKILVKLFLTLFNHDIIYPLITFKTNVKIDLIIFHTELIKFLTALNPF